MLPAPGTVSTDPLWSPPNKVAGRYLATYLDTGATGAPLKELR